MKSTSGIMIRTGTCWAFSSARWRRLVRISWLWMRSTRRDRDAEAVGLHHREAEGLEVGERGALGHGAHGLDAAHAELHLLQQAGELLVERARRCSCATRLDRGVEAESGLDRDRSAGPCASGSALRISVSRFCPAL